MTMCHEKLVANHARFDPSHRDLRNLLLVIAVQTPDAIYDDVFAQIDLPRTFKIAIKETAHFP